MVSKLMILFLCFSTRRESENSIFDETGSLKRLIKILIIIFSKNLSGDGVLISFLRGVPPSKVESNTTNKISLLILLQNYRICFYDHRVLEFWRPTFFTRGNRKSVQSADKRTSLTFSVNKERMLPVLIRFQISDLSE